MATAEALTSADFYDVVSGLDEAQLEAAARADLVYLAQNVEHEHATQARFNRWLGSLAVDGVVEVAARKDETNLFDTIHEARNGSAEALKSMDVNVGTATAEGVFKKDYISEVFLQKNEEGELTQYGQSMLSVYANALTMRPGRHPILQEITHAEAFNGHYNEDFLKAGLLKDHYFVVASIVPGGVPAEQLGHKGDGYFLEDLTFVVQATTEQTDGNVKMESLFQAGVEAEEADSFEVRLAKRHDIDAIGEIYKNFGHVPPRTAVELLNNGLLIPKAMMPNGVADVARWVDEARGVSLPAEHYDGMRTRSKQREASLADVRQKVREELLDSADELESPMDAVKLMWQLVKKHTVEASFTNEFIDPRVFGREAAVYVDQIRRYADQGMDSTMLDTLKQKAHNVAILSGCGGGSSAEDGEDSSSSQREDSETANCEFISKKCPLCGAKNVRTLSTATFVKGSCGCFKRKVKTTT